jgi:hypothetical protein
MSEPLEDEQTRAVNNVSSVPDEFDDYGAETSDRLDTVSPLFTSVSSPPPPSNLMNNNESNLSDNNISESRWSKQRASFNSESEVGVSYVHEPAPNLNLRFFRRPGRRNAARRRREDANNNGDVQMVDSTTRPVSNIMYGDSGLVASVRRMNSRFVSSLGASGFADSLGSQNDTPSLHSGRRRASASQRMSNYLINATLVEESDPIELVEAQPVGFLQGHWKAIASFACIVLAGFAIFLALAFTRLDILGNASQPTLFPSSAPSMAPSFNPKPTLEIVQERGTIRCGLFEYLNDDSFRYQLVCCYFNLCSFLA